MAKSSARYICNECGTISQKWAGQCGDCGAWNSISEEIIEQAPKGLGAKKGKSIEFTAVDASVAPLKRHETGISELDRVLGGGLVPGSAILLGGDPGIGKSTLLLQLVAQMSGSGHKCAYISGEESVAQLQLRAQRMDVAAPNVELATANSVRDIITSLDSADAPDVVIIDSIQTMFIDSIDAAPGTVSQVRASSNELIKLAKRKDIAIILVGHVTKDGQIAGPRVMEHMVDAVLYFEGDRGHQFRILRGVKNRFGATDEIGVFAMEEKGLIEVQNPSSLFISDRDEAVSGSVVFAGMEGSRPMLVEIQALVAESPLATPRRAVVGWDSNRLAMVLAVLEARCGIRFSDKEVYLNVAGGMRISEPAADLAVAAALLSALNDLAMPAKSVWFGEIALSGEARPVGRSDQRLKESRKLGFELAYCPVSKKKSGSDAGEVQVINHVQELVALLRQTVYDNAQTHVA
ncbi:MAG: DNA repair protein RadA [Rickettsiales bacterium]|nr:DNA repair protein RadA [Rickettsiales bacterium]